MLDNFEKKGLEGIIIVNFEKKKKEVKFKIKKCSLIKKKSYPKI